MKDHEPSRHPMLPEAGSVVTFMAGMTVGCVVGAWYTMGMPGFPDSGAGVRLLARDAALPAPTAGLPASTVAAAAPECVTPAFPVVGSASDWNTLKWIPPLAECRVAGLPIERLEPELNYRRGYTLGFTDDVEDKTQLLPFLRAVHDPSLSTRPRRVLLDLGGKTFDSSVMWFLRWYPLEFTEIHAFEARRGIFKKPPNSDNSPQDVVASINNGSRVSGAGAFKVPNRVLDRIHLHETFVSTTDGPDSVNIMRFMKESLKLTALDTVIVKMDIEAFEWPILQEWEKDPEMALIVDELFVEVHYKHESMSAFSWNMFHDRTREDANEMLQRLRREGYFVHVWP